MPTPLAFESMINMDTHGYTRYLDLYLVERLAYVLGISLESHSCTDQTLVHSKGVRCDFDLT